MTEQTVDSDANARNVNFFYDNAQNVYGRGLPRWKDIGVDLRGRSTVMEKSFRSTLPISEFALNVLDRLKKPTVDREHKELVNRELIQSTISSNGVWWRVRFNQVSGDPPVVKVYDHSAHEKRALIERMDANRFRSSVANLCLVQRQEG